MSPKHFLWCLWLASVAGATAAQAEDGRFESLGIPVRVGGLMGCVVGPNGHGGEALYFNFNQAGAPLFLVATSLRMVLAQRLVRTVCPQCAQPQSASPQEMAFLRSVMGEEIAAVVASAAPLRQGRGCAHCANSGFLGRRGVYELLDMTDDTLTSIDSAGML